MKVWLPAELGKKVLEMERANLSYLLCHRTIGLVRIRAGVPSNGYPYRDPGSNAAPRIASGGDGSALDRPGGRTKRALGPSGSAAWVRGRLTNVSGLRKRWDWDRFGGSGTKETIAKGAFWTLAELLC